MLKPAAHTPHRSEQHLSSPSSQELYQDVQFRLHNEVFSVSAELQEPGVNLVIPVHQMQFNLQK